MIGQKRIGKIDGHIFFIFEAALAAHSLFIIQNLKYKSINILKIRKISVGVLTNWTNMQAKINVHKTKLN